MALEVSHANARTLVQRDLCDLAPRMRESVGDALTECWAAGFDAVVYEALRSNELAAMYFQLGASKARTAFRTWHFYGLAVDVISKSRAWKAWDDPTWRDGVVRIFKAHGMDWGGDWKSFKDMPHFQWDTCKPSPSDDAIRLFNSGGIQLVQRVVGAR